MPRIGPYELHAIETGTFGLDGGAMFGVVPKPLWEKRIAPDERNRIPLAMRCLLLVSSDRVVLVDNGLGHKYSDKFAELYRIDHESVTLDRSLADVGISPDDVTDVVLSHLHFDHAGGSTARVDDRLEIVFRKARHHVQRTHWDAAIAPNPREAPSFLAENLQPLEASGLLVFCDGEQEILPGISVSTWFGHTDAMQAVRVEDADRALVFVADLIPTSHHIAPAWTMAYDIRPLDSIAERQRFLANAHANRWSVFFEHDPVVAVADVVQTDRGFAIAGARPLSEL